jgi:hypothetical protein
LPQQDAFDISREIHAPTHGGIDIGAVVSFSGAGCAEGGVITRMTLKQTSWVDIQHRDDDAIGPLWNALLMPEREESCGIPQLVLGA